MTADPTRAAADAARSSLAVPAKPPPAGSGALVFVDTETTGLGLDADIWELAAVRRDADGSEAEALHLFLQHDTGKCRHLPEPFLADHLARFPHTPGHLYDETDPATWGPVGAQVAPVEYAAWRFSQLLFDRPHLVGAVPDFDAYRLQPLVAGLDAVRVVGEPFRWHYHLIDVETLAVGYLYGRYGTDAGPPVEAEGAAVRLPWDSNALSAAVGVDPARFPRHQAMGDVRWAMAIYDAVTRGPR